MYTAKYPGSTPSLVYGTHGISEAHLVAQYAEEAALSCEDVV